jgi:LPLT family lysophospholipid transporter-like MFS transporter
MPKGFFWLILAQFFCGLADNALLVLGVCFLQEQAYPGYWAPLLKFAFTLSYVLMASWVGPLADGFSKRDVMSVMNLLKILAVLSLLMGMHPLLAFALTGLAASVYAPAKYGLVIETVPSSRLVQANAWVEVTMVVSILCGVVLGGWLMGLGGANSGLMDLLGVQDRPSWWVQTDLVSGLAVVVLLYGLSAFSNLGILATKPKVHHALAWRDVRWLPFWRNNRQLWADTLGGVSLRVTTLSWGVGAVLQFVVLVWAQTQGGLNLQQGAYLQGVVALGVIGGAIMAALKREGFKSRQSLRWALVLAVLMPCLAFIRDVWMVIPVLVLAGWSGGMLLIPMNAMLQRRGKKCMSAGRSIAVQGFNENLSVLMMLAAYSLMLSWEWSLLTTMVLMSLPLWMAAAPWLMSLRRPVSTA